MSVSDPFGLTAAEIARLLIPGTAGLPELESARQDVEAFRRSPAVQQMLRATQYHMDELAPIPQTAYTHYRLFKRTGDRTNYETPYFTKRARMAAAAIRLFLGQAELKDVVQDYVWSICEETNWVVPAHENRLIDLFAAETSFLLAELLVLLGDTLEAEVRARVRGEIERRVFDPYVRFAPLNNWYDGHNNWAGVCNGSVACAFLLLEPEAGRVARALEIAFVGLRAFFDNAFERDGSSTEGVGYWRYGLLNVIALSEMLRARTNGALDLLDSEHVRKIAAYPAKLHLSGPYFAPFSDCDDQVVLHPGVTTKLVERTGETSLLNLERRLPPTKQPGRDFRLPMILRDMVWWDGQVREAALPQDDAYLPIGGVARLVGRTPNGAPLVLAIKAGHNAENHNQNDVGSFVLHVDGETFLTDPSRGLYSRQYFGPERYDNVFANSYGHSVPRIGGQLQREGREFYCEMLNVEIGGMTKRVELEMARAYPVANLASLRRQIVLDSSGTVTLQDMVRFAENPMPVEVALVTWLEVQAGGGSAVIHGERHAARLTIESPSRSSFQVERLEEQCRANAKPGILKRITVALPAALETRARIRIDIL
jgi:hypothetical protein